MVDLGGNFNGYMNDMSRVFSIGKLPEEAYTAHQVCLDIQTKIASIAKPGIACEVLYDIAVEIAKKPDLPTNLWEQGNKPSLSATVSDSKLMKLRYWLPHETTIRTGHGLCPRTENRYSECRPRRY